MRQLIIARKDLNMSPGKLAAQVAHASLAFISHKIQGNGRHMALSPNYLVQMILSEPIYEDWFCGIFTKTVCEARNYNHLLKAKEYAEKFGMVEGQDFFLIWDACLTELQPEAYDKNGVGRTLTCIGFKPLDDETAWKISKKFQLYK